MLQHETGREQLLAFDQIVPKPVLPIIATLTRLDQSFPPRWPLKQGRASHNRQICNSLPPTWHSGAGDRRRESARREHGVAVEINAQLDLDWRWHETALRLGCLMSINPDAHSTRELDLTHWGVEMARKGGVPKGRVLNCLSRDEFADYLEAAGAPPSQDPLAAAPGASAAYAKHRGPERRSRQRSEISRAIIWFMVQIGRRSTATPFQSRNQSSSPRFSNVPIVQGATAMASEKNLQELFRDTLKDIYFAEKKILSALPKMAKAAQSQDLKAAFEKHETETEEHVARLEKVFEEIDESPRGKTCDAIMGIIGEGQEVMKDFKGAPALDAGLLAAAQAVEHYEIARYGTLKTWAQELGLNQAVKLLETTLSEEKKTDEMLTQIAEREVNQHAQAA
jgi:ferritin-like metal-binding protein YciE